MVRSSHQFRGALSIARENQAYILGLLKAKFSRIHETDVGFAPVCVRVRHVAFNLKIFEDSPSILIADPFSSFKINNFILYASIVQRFKFILQ